MASDAPSGRGFRPERVFIVGGGIALAALLFIVGGLTQSSDDPEPDIPSDIVTLLPAPGSVTFRQDEIGADLRPLLIGTVAIDGREIPEDQITVRDLGTARRVTFRPGDDLAIEELEPGRHRATMLWWSEPEGRPEEEALLNSYSWDFIVE